MAFIVVFACVGVIILVNVLHFTKRSCKHCHEPFPEHRVGAHETLCEWERRIDP